MYCYLWLFVNRMCLERIGVVGYTIVPSATGRGERGVRCAGAAMMTIACDAFQTSQVIEAMRPILKRYGGICLVSDAMWMIHGS